MRVLVCGSRDWTDAPELERVLDKVASVVRVDTVIEGEQRGADLLARAWADARGVAVDPYPAEWGRLGKPAGRIRNRRMLNEGRPDLVIAFPFPSSVGTLDMIEIARGAGVPVWVMPADEAVIDALGEGVFA
jgi:hypothetical protein